MFKINTEKYIIREFAMETILIDIEKGQSHILDDIGTIMFNIIKKYGIENGLMNLCSNFPDIDPKVLERDYNNFVDKLISKEILKNE